MRRGPKGDPAAINGKTPDAGGTISLTADDIPETDGRKFVSPGEKNDWNGKASTTLFTGLLSHVPSDWLGDTPPYTQDVPIQGIVEGMTPIADIILSADPETARSEEASWALVSSITTGDGIIKVRCLDDRPSVPLNIQLKVVE